MQKQKPAKIRRLRLLGIQKHIKNQSGQMLIETVLLSIVSVTLFISFVKYAQENRWAAKLVSEPWGTARGMIESGSWKKPEEAKKQHPNQINRSASWDPSS